MKLVDMLADVLDDAPEAPFLDNMTRMHEPEVEDLFHGIVHRMDEADVGYEIAFVAGVDMMLYALRRHGMPEDFLAIFEVEL